MPRPAERIFAVFLGAAFACVASLASLASLTCLEATARADDAPSTLAKKTPASDAPFYMRAFATLGSGIGIRFNNPYRLSRPIGDSAEGPSTTSPWLSLGLGATFGDPFGLQHGAVLRWDRTLSGVRQNVITPSYIALRRFVHFELHGRIGLPLILDPDPNLGTEVALGAAYFPRAGLGIGLETIGNLFFGAATPENKHPVYPMLSGQVSLIVEWEKLP